MKNGYAREHRMAAWDAGLLTDKRQIVHHKNGIKTDNRIENLEVKSNADHTSLHWKGTKRKPWSKERRVAKSQTMKGNQNWRGKNPDLLTNPTS
jgi:hypothetical protein